MSNVKIKFPNPQSEGFEPTKSKQIYTKITEKDYAQIMERSHHVGIPVSSYLRALVKRHLRENPLVD